VVALHAITHAHHAFSIERDETTRLAWSRVKYHAMVNGGFVVASTRDEGERQDPSGKFSFGGEPSALGPWLHLLVEGPPPSRGCLPGSLWSQRGCVQRDNNALLGADLDGFPVQQPAQLQATRGHIEFSLVGTERHRESRAEHLDLGSRRPHEHRSTGRLRLPLGIHGAAPKD